MKNIVIVILAAVASFMIGVGFGGFALGEMFDLSKLEEALK